MCVQVFVNSSIPLYKFELTFIPSDCKLDDRSFPSRELLISILHKHVLSVCFLLQILCAECHRRPCNGSCGPVLRRTQGESALKICLWIVKIRPFYKVVSSPYFSLCYCNWFWQSVPLLKLQTMDNISARISFI